MASADVMMHFLDSPGVSVRVVEVEERLVVTTLRLHTSRHLTVDEMLRTTVRDPTLVEPALSGLDVVDDQVAALQRARLSASAEPCPEHDRAGRARRCHLDDTKVLVRCEVRIEGEPEG